MKKVYDVMENEGADFDSSSALDEERGAALMQYQESQEYAPDQEEKVIESGFGFAHPLAGCESEMGGFFDSIKKVISGAKATVKKEVKTQVGKVITQAKTGVGKVLGTTAAKISSDPKVQALVVEQAQEAAVQSTAGKLNEMVAAVKGGAWKKPAMIAGGLLIAFVLYKKFMPRRGTL